MLKAGSLLTLLRGSNNSFRFRFLNKVVASSKLNFVQTFPFSQEPSKKGWDLTDEEQRAIVSYYAFDQIIKTEEKDFENDSRSIRERIFKREYLTQCILEKANLFAQLKRPQPKNTSEENNAHRGFTDLYEIGFSEVNIDKVLKAFDSQRGIRYDPNIWTQNRFAMALSPNDLLVLMPNLRTGRIFKVINETKADQYTTFGEKGTGKSFAFFIYDYLSTFIIDYRLSLINSSKTPSELFTHFIPSDQLTKFKKLFYIAIKEVKDEGQLLIKFKKQFTYDTPKYIKKDVSSITIQKKITNFLSQIFLYYNEKQIKTVCVVDQINAYYSYIRQMITNMKDIAQARTQSYLLQLLYKQFNLIAYNSAQELQSNFIRFFNSSNTARPYFDPYDHDRSVTSNQNIRYSRLLSQKQGHIYLYSVFWDELCKNYQNIRLSENESVHNYFKEAFGLQKGSQAVKQVSFVWWKYDVRHVAINDLILERKINNPEDQTLIQQNDKEGVIKIFQDMKETIEKKRLNQLKDIFRRYEDNAIKQHLKTFRHYILEHIFATAAAFERKENMNFFIKVNFSELVKQFKQKYGLYSSEIDQEIKHLTQQLGLGYKVSNAHNNTQFGFLIDNEMLSQISKLIYQDLAKINRLIQFYILDKSLSVRAAGDLIDVLHFQFFRQRIEILKIEKRNSIGNFTQFSYLIAKALPFIASTQTFTTQLKNSLKEIINLAKIQDDTIYLGYPVLMYESKKQNNEKLINYRFYPNNPIFDFLMVSSSNDTLYVRTFDTTVGEIQKKISEINLQAIEWQIQEISQEYNMKVVWQHTIMGLQRCIDNWINSGNRTGLNQTWFLQQKVEPTLRWQNGESKVVGSLKLSLSKFKVNQIYDHCVLPFAQYKLQRQLWSSMKQVMDELDKIKLFQEAYHKNRNGNDSTQNKGIKQQARAQVIIWQMVREAQKQLVKTSIVEQKPFLINYFDKKNLSEILKMAFDKSNLKNKNSKSTEDDKDSKELKLKVFQVDALLQFFYSIAEKSIRNQKAQKAKKNKGKKKQAAETIILTQKEIQQNIKAQTHFAEQMKEYVTKIVNEVNRIQGHRLTK